MGDPTIHDVIDQGLVTPIYQPLVDLYSGEVLGYEALARGPEGPLHTPDKLFAAGREARRLADLDRACAVASVTTAMEAGVARPITLFVNAEPDAIGTGRRPGEPGLEAMPPDLDLIIEITERALTARPARLLPYVEEMRAHGIGIALDDVGVDRRSLALMPFLRPDVIKLDLSLTQHSPSAAIADVHNAVSAHAERTGAAIVAEGIETEEHAERARAMGATVGQGWLFGRPGPLPVPVVRPSAPIPRVVPDTRRTAGTPFGCVLGQRPLRRGNKRLLLEISRELERQAGSLGDSAVLISTFQEARHYTPRQAGLYSDLAESLAFVGALGRGLSSSPSPGVRGADLPAGDALAQEWDIVVISPHFAAAFTAIDLGDTGVADMDRRFDFQLTHDRDLAVAAARTLMRRIGPATRVSHAPALAALT